jgi:hypothetical protein
MMAVALLTAVVLMRPPTSSTSRRRPRRSSVRGGAPVAILDRVARDLEAACW